jgi:nitroreductase
MDVMTAEMTGTTHIDQQQFLALAHARRSTRSFSPRTVDASEIEALIEAARWAPSPSNRQPWKFLTIDSKAVILNMREAVAAECQLLLEKRAGQDARAVEEYLLNFTHFGAAPLLMAIQVRRTRNRLADADASDIESEGAHMAVGMAMQNILLAACARGLVACPMSGPMIARTALESILEIASPWSLMALIPVGWPGPGQPLAPERKRSDLIWSHLSDPA